MKIYICSECGKEIHPIIKEVCPKCSSDDLEWSFISSSSHGSLKLSNSSKYTCKKCGEWWIN